MITVTRKFEFEACHYLPFHKGKCKNMHGHTYKLEVSVRSTSCGLGKNAMIIDFKDLDRVVRETQIDKLDHTVLNELYGDCSTAENMVRCIARELNPVLEKSYGVLVHRIRLYETSNSYAEYVED